MAVRLINKLSSDTARFEVAVGIFYGASDELHQLFVPQRSASGFDIFIDGRGSFIGSLFYPIRKLFSRGVGFSHGV